MNIGICRHCKKIVDDSSLVRMRYKNYCSQSCYYKVWRKTVNRTIITWRQNNRNQVGCCLCGFIPVDWAHIKASQNGGKSHKDNLAPLCPNHHRLYDRGQLSTRELSKIVSAADINVKSKSYIDKYIHKKKNKK